MLDKILAGVRAAARARAAVKPGARLEKDIASRPATADFAAALLARPDRLNIIAEIKRASPSAGLIRPDLDPAVLALDYQRAGAAAVSVLTERNFFRGSLDDLAAVKQAVAVPVLQKDFVVDPYQVLEARAAGADAVLLIVALLPPATLAALYRLARSLGLACLVETHAEAELDAALDLGAGIIGVNNRNLASLETDLGVSRRLLPLVPGDRVAVAESGLKVRRDLLELAGYGASAFLVGETLLNDPDPAAALAVLLGDK